ncbi:uncharacterized protein LOC132747084 [Ruditapes philippinarum]|uniref:uncharacterized protein LOC132747084 n=1 Tax=Ruditapes philippinarum TaxID=129788 RepID=UPI00295AF2B6|nr:uncharacterized protein LOC132747084 [Ruditapes philippinarum]
MLLHHVCMLLVMCNLALAGISAPTKTLKFECYPNNTVKVENPGNFTYVHANNSVTVCSTTWSAGNGSVYIDGCRKDDDIIVFFSNLESDFLNVLGGKEREAYAIDCKEIPLIGVNFTVTNGVHVELGELEQTTYANFDPELNITSGIYIDALGISTIDVVETGTPLFWLIKIKTDNYRIRPDNCWAYAGKNIIDTVPKKKVYSKGCTTDDQLVSTFYKIGTGAEGRRALIHTFKFYGSDYVTFVCQVRVCPINSMQLSFCDSLECDTGRKKRNTHQALVDTKEVTVSRTIRIVDNSNSSTLSGVPDLLLIVLSSIVCFLNYNKRRW